MAEFLVYAEDSPLSGDGDTDRHRAPKGAVICIQPDGWKWSEAELNNPKWSIVTLPGVDPSLLTQFTNPEIGYLDREAELLNTKLRRWSQTFDLDTFHNEMKTPATKLEVETDPAKALEMALVMAKVRPAAIADINALEEQTK